MLSYLDKAKPRSPLKQPSPNVDMFDELNNFRNNVRSKLIEKSTNLNLSSKPVNTQNSPIKTSTARPNTISSISTKKNLTINTEMQNSIKANKFSYVLSPQSQLPQNTAKTSNTMKHVSSLQYLGFSKPRSSKQASPHVNQLLRDYSLEKGRKNSPAKP